MTRDKAMFVGASSGAMLLAGIAWILATCCGTSGSWAVDLLGVPRAVALARLRYVQPYETVGAIALLGAVFWLAYRPAVARSGGGRQDRLVERWIAWIAMILIVALLSAANAQFFIGEAPVDRVGSTF